MQKVYGYIGLFTTFGLWWLGKMRTLTTALPYLVTVPHRTPAVVISLSQPSLRMCSLLKIAYM